MKSIYVHIPFCVKKCHYCDFFSGHYSDETKEKYVSALTEHINSSNIKKTETIFIGGGTPTILSDKLLSKLLESLSQLSPKEFTVEANPCTITKEKLSVLKGGGVTRLSIGMQSSEDRLLKIIGRSHTNDEFLKCAELAKQFGFTINADAMFGLPSQTVKDWEKTLCQLISLDIPHVSCYSLTIAENTPFGKKLPFPLPTEEEERLMYSMAEDILGEAGINRYEVSNYARDGHQCLHNLMCWKGMEYRAFGSSAHGYEENIRYCYDQSVEEYIKMPHKTILEKLSEDDKMSEFCILSLRLVTGIDIKEFREKFNTDIFQKFDSVINKNIALGLLKSENNHISLTKQGFDIANTVMADFL